MPHGWGWLDGEVVKHRGIFIIKQKTWGFMRIYHQTHGDLTSCKDMGILVVNTATLIPLVMKHAMATESLPFKQVMQFRNVGFSVAMFNVLQGVSIVVFGALPQFFSPFGQQIGRRSDTDAS